MLVNFLGKIVKLVLDTLVYLDVCTIGSLAHTKPINNLSPGALEDIGLDKSNSSNKC